MKISYIETNIKNTKNQFHECIQEIQRTVKDHIIQIKIFSKKNKLPINENPDISDLIPINQYAQKTLCSNFIFEVWHTKHDVIYKQYKQKKYSMIFRNNKKEIFVQGIYGKGKNIKEKTRSAFIQTKELLESENLNFSNIVRQWNYIGNITKVYEKVQNYQIFNTIRSNYYNSIIFENGYPAATGIGVDDNSFSIDIIANNQQSTPIINPNQINPYSYSSQVLEGSNITPKFERGKISNNRFYISGTAAIKGEKSISGNITKQYLETLHNISSLVQQNKQELYDLSNVKIFLKNSTDFTTVNKLNKKYLKNISTIILEAEICRDSLLIEIEGNIF